MLSWSKFKQIPIRKKALSLIYSQKRASFSFPFFLKAGMTVEGCLVLPLFLFYMATLLYSLEIVRFQSDAYEALHQVGTESSFLAYERVYGTGQEDTDRIPEKVKEYLDSRFLPYLCVSGQREGMTVQTKRDSYGEGNLEITASYGIKPFIFRLPVGNLRISQSYLIHDFVGYKGEGSNGEDSKEQYVYMTPSGSKYHFSQECTYLKVMIKAVPGEKTEELRNSSGARYYPCEQCRPSGTGLCYVTEWGTRYHAESDCPALKRTVYIVTLTEAQAEGRTVCSKCG